MAAARMACFAKGRALVEKTSPNLGTVKDSAVRRLAVQQFLVQRFLVREASVQCRPSARGGDVLIQPDDVSGWRCFQVHLLG